MTHVVSLALSVPGHACLTSLAWGVDRFVRLHKCATPLPLNQDLFLLFKVEVLSNSGYSNCGHFFCATSRWGDLAGENSGRSGDIFNGLKPAVGEQMDRIQSNGGREGLRQHRRREAVSSEVRDELKGM